MATPTDTTQRTVLGLTPQEAAQTAELAREVAGRFGAADDPELVQEAPLLASRLPERVQRFLRAFALDQLDGYCTIGGHLVDDRRIGRTPPHWKDETRTHHELPEEVLLVLYAALIGEPFGWKTQQDGHLVNDVFPIPEYENQLLGTGSRKALTLHTEDAFHPYRADYIVLASLRNPDAVPVVIAQADFARLPEADLDVLFADRFRIIPDSSHLPKNNTVRSEADRLVFAGIEKIVNDREPVSLLFGSRLDPLLRFDATHMTPVDGDEEAARVFALVNDLLDESRRPCALAPGDFVFLNNHRVVHARGSFAARYDGTDRWLKRINITHDLRKSARFRRPETPRLIG
ncbi:guanitoxin biosynthesis L-enduracididine beta-hydroxylase GntD [Kitasatospora brasiliensis]|uniref:guanitoxin biosynthesis L-enduracididine beta-hydroxylase GntD n=1 Tax=Kitasatospora brasiliensis TaxID=3058040 RepID=UPI00292F786F|nr:guanitoxin biosynthesis L-enduracididine beta-hydroxylase GntD [Kitasatospora sp. K002]